MKNQEAYKQAKIKLEARYGFYTHLIVYLAVNLLLLAINFTNLSEGIWFIYPLGGWGIGLFFHALGVFVFEGRRSLVTKKMIERELHKESFRNV